MNIRILFFAIVLLTFSCSGRETSIPSFLKRISEDEAFFKVKERDEFVFRCRYLPPQYLALKNYPADSLMKRSVKKAIFEQDVREFSKGRYFQLSLGRKDHSDFIKNSSHSLADYSRKQRYLYTGLIKDVYIQTEEGIIFPISHQYNRTYGMNPDLNFLFVFPKKLPRKFTLVFKDRITGSPEAGNVEFTFNLADISTEGICFEELI